MKYILAVRLDVWETSCMVVFHHHCGDNLFLKKEGPKINLKNREA